MKRLIGLLVPCSLLLGQQAFNSGPRPRILGVAHIAVFAADYEKSRAFYHDFLGFEEAYSLSNPNGTPSMTFFKINERQYIELFPQTAAGTDRLNHISIETDNAEAMRRYLAGRGVAVPERVGKGRIGNSNFNVKDPEGHTVEIVQYEPDGWTVRERGRHIPASRVSSHMMHAGIIVTKFEAEMKFYRDVLGFRETWRGGRSGDELSWVNLQVPDGDDYIELMLYKEAPPPDRRGTAHHLALEVPDIGASLAGIEARPYRKQYARPIQSQTGVNRKRQANLYDPDGTRIELMEPGTVDGKPAPSSQALPPGAAQSAAAPIGLFESHSDIGTVLHAGAVEYDVSKRMYTVTASGENLWARADDFQYVWKKVSGDVTLTADMAFAGTGGNAHRKGVLMIRQSLDTDSAYVDGALHGNGLTSIQARDEKGAITHEVQSWSSAPKRLRIAKRGADFYVFAGGEGEEFRLSGGSMKVKFAEPFYVGIGVCAHDKNAVEKVLFSNVDLTAGAPVPRAETYLHSTLEIVRMAALTDHRALLVVAGRMEAPAWTRDGASVIFSRDGNTYRMLADGGKAEVVDTGFATRSNGHHGVSPDGNLLAISDESADQHQSTIYVLPLAGGTPKRITTRSPSRFHGWSPDGNTLVFTGVRGGKTGIYTVPSIGGAETRLTDTGLNDNPEYAPDGKAIYFNSDRGGAMQVWRMRSDGTAQEQVTSDAFHNCFPHLSPDGQRLAFLSYPKNATACAPDSEVALRVFSPGAQKTDVLATLLGGPGSMGAPFWSPDGRRMAFVSYQLIPK